MVQEVDITSSLCQAVLLSATYPLPVVLIVSVLELRHAPAMLELLVKSARVLPGWIVASDQYADDLHLKHTNSL